MLKLNRMLIVEVVIVVLVMVGCNELTEVFEQGLDNPTPTPTSYISPDYPFPAMTPTSGNSRGLVVTPTPIRGMKETPTPVEEDIYTTVVGEHLEIPMGERTSGTFYFEARGFFEEKFPGDESWMKPVYFWIYNDDSGFNYDGPGLLFQVLQILHAGYWCEGGKLHLRNHNVWLAEVCYQYSFENDRWYHIEVKWEDKYIKLFIDGEELASAYTNSIVGPITAGIGWPPTRREGIEGLQYKNYGFR